MPKRYFFFSYSCRNKTKEAVGNLWLSCDDFPYNKLIRRKIAEISGFDPCDCVVTGIFEFKSEEDFDSFREETVQRLQIVSKTQTSQ